MTPIFLASVLIFLVLVVLLGFAYKQSRIKKPLRKMIVDDQTKLADLCGPNDKGFKDIQAGQNRNIKRVRFAEEQTRIFGDSPSGSREIIVDCETRGVKVKDASLNFKDPRYQARFRTAKNTI